MSKCNGGCKSFWITEALLWDAELFDGAINCKNKDCEIREIVCKECMVEYNTEYFDNKNIEINFD